MTVKVNGVAAETTLGGADGKVVRGRGNDSDAGLVPVRALFTESVAVMVCVPAVVRMALNTPTPAVSVALGGSNPLPSLPVKCTVPGVIGSSIGEGVFGCDCEINWTTCTNS